MTASRRAHSGSAPPHRSPSLPRSLRDFGHLILKDGTSAAIRVAQPDDRAALHVFADRLSPESKRHRFFSEGEPPAALINSLCDPSDPRSKLTLVVTRMLDGVTHIIATGSYWAQNEHVAEVAMAVDDNFHGKGLGTLLLEWLALFAAHYGFRRLSAVTHADNLAMRQVFRESGLEVRESFEGSDFEVELSAVPDESSAARSDLRDRVATTASLRPFFWPKSVTVIGASRDSLSLGYRILDALIKNGFQGPVYPVNPKADAVMGLHCYHSVRDLPDPVDLAIVVVPRDTVLQVVDECAGRGVRALVVITAGFAEVGTEGRALQNRLVEKVRQYGMRLVGPNCMGLLNVDPAVRLNASFSPVFPPSGRVAMSSQSGALGVAILAAATRLHVGLSTFVSVGNKADVSGNDLLQYWEDDPNTDVILLYLESFGNPRRFARIARRVSRHKPIIAVKAGRTQAGRRAAGSHTAALAASDVVVDALFRQTGVIRAETLDEMLALAEALANQPLPPGRRVAIVTNAGGPAILCADACEAGDLRVLELSDGTKARLASFLPPTASLKNPVDLIASATPEQYRLAIETVLAADEVDALIVLYVSVGVADAAIADAIREGATTGRAAGGSDKPVLTCWMADDGKDGPSSLQRERIPCYSFPETAARVMSKAAAYAQWRTQPLGVTTDFDDARAQEAREICTEAIATRGSGWLSTEETRRVLEAMGLPVTPGGVAKTAEEAVEQARRIGYPVAVKLASRQVLHKTDVGGVRLNLTDELAVRQAFREIQSRLAQEHNLQAMEGVLVQPMVVSGVEVMVGATQDPLFGPLIAFGLGGIHVEVLRDVCFRVTPLTDRDAAEMVREIRGYRLLEGYRGHSPADVDAIQEVLLRISRLAEAVPEITELDLNPIFALKPGEGCRIVDARIAVGTLRTDTVH